MTNFQIKESGTDRCVGYLYWLSSHSHCVSKPCCFNLCSAGFLTSVLRLPDLQGPAGASSELAALNKHLSKRCNDRHDSAIHNYMSDSCIACCSGLAHILILKSSQSVRRVARIREAQKLFLRSARGGCNIKNV